MKQYILYMYFFCEFVHQLRNSFCKNCVKKKIIDLLPAKQLNPNVIEFDIIFENYALRN